MGLNNWGETESYEASTNRNRMTGQILENHGAITFINHQGDSSDSIKV